MQHLQPKQAIVLCHYQLRLLATNSVFAIDPIHIFGDKIIYGVINRRLTVGEQIISTVLYKLIKCTRWKYILNPTCLLRV